MRTNTFTMMRFLTLGLAVATLQAAQPIEVHWNEVCKITGRNEIDIKTANGDEFKGYCVGIGVDEMSVRTTDGKVVKLARTTMQKIRMHRVKSGQLRSLGKGMHNALRDSFAYLFSPLAPIGMVGVPGTLAWGAVAAPFCAISDVHDKLHGTREIKVM